MSSNIAMFPSKGSTPNQIITQLLAMKDDIEGIVVAVTSKNEIGTTISKMGLSEYAMMVRYLTLECDHIVSDAMGIKEVDYTLEDDTK